ncbi:MAG: transposase [Halobacteriales archaeon]|nr:transposase [Halobacteriales archaeon]
MRQPKPELTDAQWARISRFFPVEKPSERGGRPWADNRATMEGILWVMRMGARWNDVPEPYPSGATCWRRLQRWEKEGRWVKAWQGFVGQLDDEGLLSWKECFLDASFSPAKKGVKQLVPLAKAKVPNGWWWQTVAVYQSAILRRLQAQENLPWPKPPLKL